MFPSIGTRHRAPRWKRAAAILAAIAILLAGFLYLVLIVKNPSTLELVIVSVICSLGAFCGGVYAALG